LHALTVVGLALMAVSAASSAGGGRLEALPVDDGIRVHVAKRGLFSAFAHDHDFEVTRWRGTAAIPDGDPGRASLELVLQAGSLRDREKGLSSGDRGKVEAQTSGPEVLDAAHAAEITYRSERVTLDERSGAGGPVRGTIHGQLTLRGRTRPVDATFEARREGDAWRVHGRARFRQSEFGIKPFSGVGGTVAVKDEVEVTFAISLRPGPAAHAASPADADEPRGDR
jgi:polyisoprenoid-binding protein YceI